MTVTVGSFRALSTAYNKDGSIATYSGAAGADLVGKPITNYEVKGTAIPLGGGAFLTAAHLFDGVLANGQTLEVKADSATINGLTASKAVYLEPWNAQTDYAGMQAGNPIPDLAVATTSEKTPSANLTPLMAFADDDAAESYLQNRSINSAGFATEPTFGSSDGIVAPGVFAADITTVSGDSGGPAYVTDQNKNGDDTTYIVGVDSHGPADPNTPGPTKFSYLKSSDYTEAMDQIPLGTDFSGLAPDVIRGEDSNEIIRTGQRKADIITNGDDNIILAGSGGGLINTGVGNNDVIFMPSADNQADPGTTVVLSPGTKTIVGGGPNDKLVLPADRLWNTTNGAPGLPTTSDSDTIQLLGGWGNVPGSTSGDFTAPDPGSYHFYSDINVTSANDDSSDPSTWELGTYDYNAIYGLEKQSDGTNDLLVDYYSADIDNSYSKTPDLWSGSVLIKDYKTGDFGLTFTSDSSFFDSLSGKITEDQFDADRTAAMTALEAAPQSQDGWDDDESVQWNGVESPRDIDSTSFPTSDELASDLAEATGVPPPVPVPIGEPAAGANQTISDNGVTISLAAGATATVSGNDDTVNAAGAASTINFGGTQEVASISSGTVDFAKGSTGKVTGTADAVALTSNNSVTMTGTGDTATIQGTGNVLSTAANQVALWNNSAATVQGDGNTVTLYDNATLGVSGQNDTVVVSGSGDTIAAASTDVEMWQASATVTGDTDTVRLYGQATVSVAGSDDSVDVSGIGNIVSASSTQMDLSDDADATASGNDDTATLHDGTALTLAGAGNMVHVAGTGNVLTTSSAKVDLWNNAAAKVTGDSNVVTLYDDTTLGLSGQNDTVVVSGKGDTISASSADVEMFDASAAVSGNANTVRLYGQATVSAAGQNDTVDVSGTGNVVSASSTQMSLSDGSAATATGNANAFTLYNNATLGFSGSADAIHVSGTGDTLSGSSGAIDLWNNAAATVSGNADDVTLYDDTKLAVSGQNNVVSVAGTGNQISASSTEIELSGGSDAVTGDYDTVRFYGQATVAASGTHETFAMAATPAAATISGFDQTDTVQFSASTFANFNALLAHASQQGADTVIKTDATHSVVLSNVALSSLSQSRFSFA